MKNLKLVAVGIIMLVTAIGIYQEKNNESKKGNWSETDKKELQKKLYESEDLSSLGDNKSKFIECCISKIEANYSSLDEANQDEEIGKKIAHDCYDEVMNEAQVEYP